MSVGAVVSQKYVMPRTNAAGKPCTIILRSKEYTTSQHGAVLAGRGNYPGQLALHGVFGMESACIEQGNDCDMLKHNQSNLPSPATMHSPNEATTSLTRPIGTRRKHGQQQNGAVQAWDARRGFNEGKKKKKGPKKAPGCYGATASGHRCVYAESRPMTADWSPQRQSQAVPPVTAHRRGSPSSLG